MKAHSVAFKPAAEADLAQAFEWYLDRSRNLASEFLEQTYDLVHRIQLNPEMFRIVYRDFRQGLTKRFPYRILFTFVDDHVDIFAVLHQRQNFQRLLKQRH